MSTQVYLSTWPRKKRLRLVPFSRRISARSMKAGSLMSRAPPSPQEKIQTHRRRVWETYYAGLKDWAQAHEVQLPHVPAHVEQAYHMFYLLLPTLDLRQGLITHLRGRGIQSIFHFLPLHLSDMGRRFGGREGDCPVTERVSDQLLRLPFHNALTPAEQERVIEAVLEFEF